MEQELLEEDLELDLLILPTSLILMEMLLYVEILKPMYSMMEIMETIILIQMEQAI